MKRYGIWILLLLARVVWAQTDHVVISELRYDERSGVNEEFVEVYNPTETAILLQSWEIQYKPATSTNWTTKLSIGAGVEILPHSYLLWGGNAVDPEPDFVESYALGLGNSGGHIRLLDADDNQVDLVGWEGANAPEGGSVAGTTADGGSLERKAHAGSTADSMGPDGADWLEGNGEDTDVNGDDFVIHTIDAVFPQNSSSPMEPEQEIIDGSGSCTVDPTTIFSGSATDLTFTLTAGDYLLESVRITLPDGFTFETPTISGDGFSDASISVEGNSATVTNAALENTDTGSVHFPQVYPTDVSNLYPILVETATPGGTLTQIISPPYLQVVGDQTAISMLHVNDEDGVPELLGGTVLVRGIVTCADEMGQPGFMQDETGGIAIYDWGFAEAVEIGDDVELTGTVTNYNGLVELSPVSITEIHDHGIEVEPMVITCHELDFQTGTAEPYEGMLIRINDVTVNTATWAGNTNYILTDASGTCAIRIDSDTDLVNAPAPSGEFDVIGLVGQYDYSAPYSSGYQLLPRFLDDVLQAPGPVIVAGPVESDIHDNGMTITFATENPGNTVVQVWNYDETQMLSEQITDEDVTLHQAAVTGMEPGNAYRIIVGSTNDEGSSWSTSYVVSSASSASTGEINVWFTRSVETQWAIPGNEANGEAQAHSRLIEFINAAEYSIDAAIYSLSIQAVADALIDAHDRGVEVRFIYDDDHDQSQVSQLSSAGIPVIDDSYGNNDGDGLQHNKFMVFDARDRSSATDDWVWTGSLNLIAAGGVGINAMQNSIAVQDQSLALAYTLEFNEMWGSDDITPNAAEAKFSVNKTDNTPHLFNIAGREVQVYFDPSDNTTSHIINLINRTEYSTYFCLLTFTRSDISDALYDRYTGTPGYQVRGVFDSGYDQYSEYEVMLGWGADVFTDAEEGLFHHKYMIGDAEHHNDGDPFVLTGSHNWSTAAETRNNENTLVVFDPYIANQYLQEFAARYHAAGGSYDFEAVPGAVQPTNIRVSRNYPNPFNPTTAIDYFLPVNAHLSLEIFDLLGRRMEQSISRTESAGAHQITLDFSNNPSGLYFYRVQVNELTVSEGKLLLVK